jgi:hypothetical protein
VFIGEALGYANRAKIAQAWSWEKTPIAIKLFIVLAERVSPRELAEIIAALHRDERERSRRD